MHEDFTSWVVEDFKIALKYQVMSKISRHPLMTRPALAPVPRRNEIMVHSSFIASFNIPKNAIYILVFFMQL